MLTCNCWDLVFTTTVSVYPTFNNKYFQFYAHYSTCCYRHLGRITAIPDDSKLLSFTLNYCSHLLWVIFIYTWLVLSPYNCSYFQAIYCSYFQVTYIIFFTILLCFRLFPSTVRPLPIIYLFVYIKRIQKVSYCFFPVKNTPKLINQQLKNRVKIVNWQKKVSYCFF